MGKDGAGITGVVKTKIREVVHTDDTFSSNRISAHKMGGLTLLPSLAGQPLNYRDYAWSASGTRSRHIRPPARSMHSRATFRARAHADD